MPPVAPDANTGDSITVTIPTIPPITDTDGKWPYGFYMLSVLFGPPDKPDQTQTTNALTLALAPQIDTKTQPAVTSDTNGVTITLNSVQQVLPTQNVSLLLDDLEVLPSGIRSGVTNVLSFTGQNIPAGN